MRRDRSILLAVLWACEVTRVLGCKPYGDTQPPTAGASELAPATPPALSEAPSASVYPPGKWRQAPGRDLDHTLLWLSHVLIRHGDADESVGFNLTGWHSAQPATTRTPEEALQIAERVAQLARDGTPFPELVRRFSEDPETAVRGGSLGGLPAGHLIMWPHALDAIETLAPGAVSNVVETPFGYHVFQRRPPVAQATVSGAHIVIAHADAPWIKLAARGTIPARARDEAWALAAQVVAEARANPSSFRSLVDKYSEHRDAQRGGDMGSWSTHEPTGYPREVETLSQLEVGAVADPIDTLFGIQIIQRTENRPRQRFAMSKIQVRFDSERPDSDPFSKPAAFLRAQQLAKTLREDPARFATLQREVCCTNVWEVIEGRDVPALEAVLGRLVPGEIAGEPIDDIDVEYLIPKRLELDVLPPVPATRFDFPPNAVSGN